MTERSIPQPSHIVRAGSRDWLKLARWLSVIFGISLIVLEIWRANGCAGATNYVFCTLKANEVGDLLAGVFSPLAFFWLAAAVLIQSQELAAQRQELRATREELELTRDEYAMSREVMKDQAAEARRSASYMEQQTAMLLAEQNDRQKAKQDEVYRHRYASLQRFLTTSVSGKTFVAEGVTEQLAPADRMPDLVSQLLVLHEAHIHNHPAQDPILPWMWVKIGTMAERVFEMKERISEIEAENMYETSVQDLAQFAPDIGKLLLERQQARNANSSTASIP